MQSKSFWRRKLSTSQKRWGLGFEFSRAADVAIASALRNPFVYLLIEEEFRRVLFRNFPYTLIYLPSQNELLIVSFFYQHREPGTWLE
jgi:hypothetical protein